MRPAHTDINPQRRKQLHVNIDAARIATGTLVHNLDVLDRLPVARVVDVDVGAAEGVVVGVRGREEGVGDGDDGLAGCGGDGAGGVCGGEVGGVDGHVAGVGCGEGDGDGEGEGAESEVAGFHGCGWECVCWVAARVGGFARGVFWFGAVGLLGLKFCEGEVFEKGRFEGLRRVKIYGDV